MIENYMGGCIIFSIIAKLGGVDLFAYLFLALYVSFVIVAFVKGEE